jgi:hypothetical protein
MSNASVDLPEPLTPVTTLNLPRGMSTLRFLRLCSLALTIWMLLFNTGERRGAGAIELAAAPPRTLVSEAAVSEGDDFGVPPPYEDPTDTAASPP